MTHPFNNWPIISTRYRWAPLLAMVLWMLTSQGCNWTLPRGEGFHDEMADWSQNVRKQDHSDGTPLGTSSKALEIERNLGYR
jgi:hypothetical protein